MKKKILPTIQNQTTLQDRLDQVDDEFKDFLAGLSFKRDAGHEKLRTFSPIDAVEDFEQDGLQAVKEITRDEMMAQDTCFNKLLANMLGQCKPGALSEDDITQIAGINGREVGASL